MFQCSTLKYLSKKKTDVHIVLGRCWHQTEWAMANLGIPECTKQVTTNENWWKVFQIYTKTHCTYGQSNHSTCKGIMPNSCNSFSFFRNNSWSNYIRQRTRTNQINRWKKTDDLYNLIRWKVKMCLCACVCVQILNQNLFFFVMKHRMKRNCVSKEMSYGIIGSFVLEMFQRVGKPNTIMFT